LLKSAAAGTPRELPACFVYPFGWLTEDGPTDPAVAGPFPLSTFFITAVPPPFFFFEGVLSPPTPALAEGELDCGPLPGTVKREAGFCVREPYVFLAAVCTPPASFNLYYIVIFVIKGFLP